MKFLKRIAVFVFIGFLCFNSVFFSYEKAYSSDAAVAPALPLAYEALVALLTLLGATAVVGCTWECLDSLDENSTPEEWKKAYNKEKELYDNFKSYYIENEGSENLYITDASGQVCYLDDILENDFPDEEEFKDLKKKSNNKKYDPTDWWQYADGLLDLLSLFFDGDDDSNMGGAPGTSQKYYLGDEGYINRDNGAVNITCDANNFRFVSSTETLYPIYYRTSKEFTVDEDLRDVYRAAFLIKYDKNIVGNMYQAKCIFYEYFKRSGDTVRWGAANATPYKYCTSWYCASKQNDDSFSYSIFNFPEFDNTLTLAPVYLMNTYVYTKNLNTFYAGDISLGYLSTNVPVFYDDNEGVALKNYMENGDASGAINLPPPTVTPDVTSAPSAPSSSVTAVSTYCNSMKGKWINSTIINNFVENLTTYIEENNITPDNTDPDYVDVVKQLANEDIVLSPTPTNVPYQGYEEDAENDGEGFSLWKFFEWLLEFFTIDMDLISSSIKVDFIPAASFQPLVDSFSKMKVAFGSDTYLTVQNENEITVVDSTIINSPGTLVADYPVISCKVPKVLDKYLVVDGDVIKEEEGEKVIILCDFADYAVYFARFRAFLIAVMWIGMLFYLMREFQVTFNIS